MRYRRLLVTGGAGFIGSSFIRHLLKTTAVDQLVNLDLLTYASNPQALEEVAADPRYRFVQGDIGDEELVCHLIKENQLQAVVHFAAETHVDRSISGPKVFAQTNVMGTLSLLEALRKHPYVHLHHISTDEVYGSIEEGEFNPDSAYLPSSPYSASKAASDHFVRAYGHTYGLSYTLSHCTNNYGPYQHPEKLIPCMLDKLKKKQPLPLYGKGENKRDWLFVDDHSQAIVQILDQGKPGTTYAISSGEEKTNVQMVSLLIDTFVEVYGGDREQLMKLITFVEDRPGHDLRYALDSSRTRSELGWSPSYSLKNGLKKTLLEEVCV